MHNDHTQQFHALSVRPADVDASAHEEIQSYIPKAPLPHRLMSFALRPAVRFLMPWMISPTEPLGRFMTELAMGRHAEELVVEGNGVQKIGDFPILENWAFRRIAKLDS